MKELREGNVIALVCVLPPIVDNAIEEYIIWSIDAFLLLLFNLDDLA